MKSKVVLIRCDSYEKEAVARAVQRGLDLLGGVAQYAKKNEKILLKPNLLAGDAPEKCTTTHPAVFKAVAKAFQKAGAIISYGDSPAYSTLAHAAKEAELDRVAQDLKIETADFKNGTQITFSEGRQNKKFVIARGVLAADGIISLPKMKTHGFQKMTGAIKNQFGCIPGPLKTEFHLKLVDSSDFARMLLDLDRLVRPRLYILDGILAMEGNGPRGGNPRQMNVLLFSQDPIALDATMCRLARVDPQLVPTVRWGQEYGCGTWREDGIELAGDDLQPQDFKVDRTPLRAYRTMGMRRRLSPLVVPKPFIVAPKCVQCGMCISACPSRPKTLGWQDGDKSLPPVYDYRHCIRCYCCQELCPEGAIELRTPWLRKLIDFAR